MTMQLIFTVLRFVVFYGTLPLVFYPFLTRIMLLCITIKLFVVIDIAFYQHYTYHKLSKGNNFHESMLNSLLSMRINTFDFSTWLIRCEDVSENPGTNHSLNIIFSNINSLKANNGFRFLALQQRAKSENAHVIALCEVGHLSEEELKSHFSIDNYDIAYYTNKNRGILIYVHISIPYDTVVTKGLIDPILNNAWILIRLDHKALLYGVFYKSPSLNGQENNLYFNHLKNNLKAALDFQARDLMIILNSDFNARNQMWYEHDINNPAGEELYNLYADLGLNQMISEPTRIASYSIANTGVRHLSKSCIDHLTTNNPGFITEFEVKSPVGNTDHCSIMSSVKFTFAKEPVIKKTRWRYDHADREGLKAAVNNFDWDTLLDGEDLDLITTNFTNTLFRLFSQFIPNKQIKIRTNDEPWFNDNIKRSINKRDKLYRNFKRTQNLAYFESFKEQSRVVETLIGEAKSNFENEFCEKLNQKTTNSNDYWSIINRLLGRKYSSPIPIIIEAVTKFIGRTNLDKANIFHRHLLNKMNIGQTLNFPFFARRTNLTLAQFSTNPEEIRLILVDLKNKKATGPDNITNEMIKVCPETIAIPISKLFIKLLRNNYFPRSWKQGDVNVIFKKGIKSKCENYRPISLLNTLSKIYERVIYNRLSTFLISNNLIYEHQSGFLKGHSTTLQLISIVYYINSELNKGNCVRSVFLDLAAAFDTVPHDLLMHKMKAYGLSNSIIDLFSSYLNERKIRVSINGSSTDYSQPGQINAGVPQGSILGPLLFLLYINDLPDNINSKCYIYADDTSIYFPYSKNDPNASKNLQNELNSLEQWSQTWKMSFKAEKSRDLTFRTIGTPYHNHDPLTLDNENIPRVRNHKHLGFFLDEILSFATHIRETEAKVQKMINPLKLLSKKVKGKHLDLIYNSYICPHFDYCDVIYHNKEKALLMRIDSLHYRAAILVSGALTGSNGHSVLRILNWNTLESRRLSHIAILMYKVKRNVCPSYIANIFQLFIPQRLNVTLRNRDDFHIPLHISTRFKESGAIYYAKVWNNLPLNIRQLPSISLFKISSRKHYNRFQSIKSNTQKLLLPRNFEIKLNQLRVGLLLNSHKMAHSFTNIDSEACRCGLRQTTRHFLLKCRLNQNLRQTMLARLHTLLVDKGNFSFNRLTQNDQIELILYGFESDGLLVNGDLLLITSQFIYESYEMVNI